MVFAASKLAKSITNDDEDGGFTVNIEVTVITTNTLGRNET